MGPPSGATCLTKPRKPDQVGERKNTQLQKGSDEGKSAEQLCGEALRSSLAPDQALKKVLSFCERLHKSSLSKQPLMETCRQRPFPEGSRIRNAHKSQTNNYFVTYDFNFENMRVEERADRMHASPKITCDRTFFHQSKPSFFPRTTVILLFVTEVVNSHSALLPRMLPLLLQFCQRSMQGGGFCRVTRQVNKQTSGR